MIYFKACTFSSLMTRAEQHHPGIRHGVHGENVQLHGRRSVLRGRDAEQQAAPDPSAVSVSERGGRSFSLFQR